MIRCLLSYLQKEYFVPEEDELAQDGEGLEILRECPSIVSDEGAVE